MDLLDYAGGFEFFAFVNCVECGVFFAEGF